MTPSPGADALLLIAEDMLSLLHESVGESLEALDLVLLVKAPHRMEIGVAVRLHLADEDEASSALVEILQNATEQAIADAAARPVDG